MIDKYDLYDLSAVFANIRSDVEYKLNIQILDKIIQVLSVDKETTEENQIRKAIAEIENLDCEKWYYVYHSNLYVNHSILENKDIYKLLITVCELLKTLLENQQYDRAYDLADAVHCLPEIIADNNFSITKSYWKININFYRKKWDKTFLKEEQKILKR